jgi:tripartite-type tricarboxylate transporter receptor subunit TctC
MRKITFTLAATAAVALLSTGAYAAGYPERNITMVVPFAAGGPTDTVTRLVAEAMSKDLGQQIIVENVGGAGGTLGAAGRQGRCRMAIRCCFITLAWRPAPRFTASCPTTR